MPSSRPSASPTAIAMAATRTAATARVALSNQASAVLQNNFFHQTPGAEGAPAATDASNVGLLKAHQSQSSARAAEAAAMDN